jgi:hypothetical protein
MELIAADAVDEGGTPFIGRFNAALDMRFLL